jgi:hypothetical protein
MSDTGDKIFQKLILKKDLEFEKSFLIFAPAFRKRSAARSLGARGDRLKKVL